MSKVKTTLLALALALSVPNIVREEPSIVKQTIKLEDKIAKVDGTFISTKEIILQEYNKQKNLPPITLHYIHSIIQAESSGDSSAIGAIGERGLMQATKTVWTDMNGRLSYDLAFNRQHSVRTGIKYLNALSRTFSYEMPDWKKLSVQKQRELISAAYNGGYGNLRKKNWNINKMYPSTREYVKNTTR